MFLFKKYTYLIVKVKLAFIAFFNRMPKNNIKKLFSGYSR